MIGVHLYYCYRTRMPAIPSRSQVGVGWLPQTTVKVSFKRLLIRDKCNTPCCCDGARVLTNSPTTLGQSPFPTFDDTWAAELVVLADITSPSFHYLTLDDLSPPPRPAEPLQYRQRALQSKENHPVGVSVFHTFIASATRRQTSFVHEDAD
ncbi:hypothetical protein AG1IA_08796 [Rhizoctonia solani AG-1 IA]|uniref:Uncharacterized protein n=1 Tax=Thanatephorus cucumeris (strain AG1-IA) TaxID=983506 RepID=L8WG59_THACA|nr:hypothetical protein AG1IA_08796 [Rhizoctonia solani AG-1 IA]